MSTMTASDEDVCSVQLSINRAIKMIEGSNGTGGAGKAIVVGAVRRKGNVIARVIGNVKADTLTEFVREIADELLPGPRILHPWPRTRFAVKHPR